MKPGVWMISKKRWAVTLSDTTFDPADPQGVLGYVIQGEDGKWSIDGDSDCCRHHLAEHAVQDLVRSHTADSK